MEPERGEERGEGEGDRDGPCEVVAVGVRLAHRGDAEVGEVDRRARDGGDAGDVLAHDRRQEGGERARGQAGGEGGLSDAFREVGRELARLDGVADDGLWRSEAPAEASVAR